MITTEAMKALEESSGMSKQQLMENAGRGVAAVLKQRFPELKDKKILFICYHGNNGGDGFTAARYLCDECSCDVLFIGEENRLAKEAAAAYKKLLSNEKVQLFDGIGDINFDDYDIIVDAILGTGIQGRLKENISNVIESLNKSEAFKVSIDIPTGINPDTGIIEDKAVQPDLIITMHDLKPGLMPLKDKTVVVDIGIKK